MDNDVLIKYEDVVIQQGGYNIITNVSFTVKTGELVYIIGSVGTGKSSLLRTIYADLNLGGGNATVLGYNMYKIKRRQIPDLRKREGIIFQDYKLLNDMTIAKNLEFVLRATGMKQKAEIKERISKALERVGLNGKDNKYPNELSGGEQQRAAIARAMINNPQVILADEPTGNLDKETALNVTKLLAEFTTNGTAVIMSTHNTDLITNFAGTVYRCGEGTFKDVTNEFRSVEDKDTL